MKNPIANALLFISLILFIGCQPKPITEESVNSFHDEVSQRANTFAAETNIPGMAIMLYKKGEVVYSEGIGYADLEQKVTVDPLKTKFRIASISKTLTADALVQLQEAGRLDLDAEVQKYVTSFPKKRWPVTTRLAAGHIAGIRHYRGNEFYSAKHYATVLEGLDIFKDDSLLFEPGSKYAYSSYGFNLVSAVIEGASGQEFLDYMQANVFDALGMTNTTPEYMDVIIANRGRYYEMSDGEIINAPFVDNSYKWAGGGFLSTAEDLLTFAKAHLREGYLSQSSLTTLTTSQVLSDGSETGYGLGWSNTEDKEGYHWLGHSGGAVGGSSKMAIYPEEEVIVVVLTNVSGAPLGDFPHELARMAIAN